MTPAARIAAAIEVFADIETRRRPVADALKDWGLAHRFAGSGDRGAIGNIVYDALRHRSSVAYAMGSDTPRALIIGTVGRHWGTDVDAFGASLVGPHAPEPLTEAERAGIAADISTAPGHVQADIPEWLAPRFEAMFDGEWVGEGAALAARPPLDLRANTLKSDREKVLKALARHGAVETRYAPDAVRIAPTSGPGRHPNVQSETGFQKGWFEIQDEGSQLAALLSGAQPGEQIIDLCAGGGGKTLALAAAMANKGQLHATDSDRGRLAPIHERLRRAGTRNVQVIEARAPLDPLHGRMDRVLIDAPCTGTGTWRRRPDAKWRVTPKALDERQAEQAEILDSAVPLLKPGGAIVYITCSVLPDENTAQLSAFTARHPGFAPVAGAEVIAAGTLPEAARTALAKDALVLPEGVVMTPRRTGTDGFFVSVLRRR